MDSHNTQRYVTREGFVQNEGDVQQSPGGAYAISYRAMTSKRGEVDNLLVPVSLSASHIAYGSIRMEPVFMVLGQSAATAAVIAISEDQAVQDVDYKSLRKRLLADGQVLDIPEGTATKRLIAADKLDGVVIDDARAEFKGIWIRSGSVGPFVENGYQHDGNVEKGEKTALFATRLKAGRYEVRLGYTANKNRADNVPVRIVHADGIQTAKVNQRNTPRHDNLFDSLGTFDFNGAKDAKVEIGTEGTNGYVIVDAVQFLPVK